MDNKDSRPARLLDGVFKLINGVAWVCFVTMIVVMLLQVFTRYIVNHPLAWTEELSRFSYIWAIFLGSIIAQRSRSHMTVTILLEKLSPGTRNLLQVFTDLFSIAALMVALYGTILQMIRNYGILASSIPVSYTYVYLAPAIGSGAMILLLIASFRRDLKTLFSASR